MNAKISVIFICDEAIIYLLLHNFASKVVKFDCIGKYKYKNKKTLWHLFMDGVQLPQGYRAITRRQFTFYH